MTLVMALHHTHGGFWHFFLDQSSSVFPDVILVPNYHSYKEKTIKLLPYHTSYEGHIPSRKIEPQEKFSDKPPEKIQSHQDAHLAVFP